jgi:hypothetical protein
MGAFFRSLLLPGWSQSILDRRLTAGLFMAVEGLAVGMVEIRLRTVYLQAVRPAKSTRRTRSARTGSLSWHSTTSSRRSRATSGPTSGTSRQT